MFFFIVLVGARTIHELPSSDIYDVVEEIHYVVIERPKRCVKHHPSDKKKVLIELSVDNNRQFLKFLWIFWVLFRDLLFCHIFSRIFNFSSNHRKNRFRKKEKTFEFLYSFARFERTQKLKFRFSTSLRIHVSRIFSWNILTFHCKKDLDVKIAKFLGPFLYLQQVRLKKEQSLPLTEKQKFDPQLYNLPPEPEEVPSVTSNFFEIVKN